MERSFTCPECACCAGSRQHSPRAEQEQEGAVRARAVAATAVNGRQLAAAVSEKKTSLSAQGM